jgi:hypothetical protein
VVVVTGGAALPSGIAEPIRNTYLPASNFRIEESDPADIYREYSVQER